MFEQVRAHIAALEERVCGLDVELAATPLSQNQAEISGVGQVIVTTMALTTEPGHFTSGRYFAAWLGLTPREYCTCGKQRLGKISPVARKAVLLLGCHERSPPGSAVTNPDIMAGIHDRTRT